MIRLLQWIVLAAIVAFVLVVARDPKHWLPRFGIELRGRTEGLPRSFYKPRAIVRGSNQPFAPKQDPSEEKLDPVSLQAAADYAESHHSLALIVTRHGYRVFEKYWHGSSLETVVESPGLGRVLTALATGAAISQRKIGWPDEPLGYLVPAWSKDPRGELTVRDLLQQGGDPDLLAYTIQLATGQPYPQFLSREIWARIGAADASLWMERPDRAPHVDEGFFARQGDWLRVGELLLSNGNYQGDEVLVPRWVPELLKPGKKDPSYGSYLHLGARAAPGMTPYATPEVFVVEGGGNRMWLVPSLQLAILRTGAATDGDWDDGRIPNLIIRGARDFVPAAARPGADLRQLVPNH